jgi:DNA polymerase-3 subunit epsilon
MSHRIIVLDTETTGLSFHKGERLVEIGLVEVIDRMITGRMYHQHINPQRTVDPDAQRVHGLSNEFLADKPKFAEVADEILAFIDGDELIIHNAEFDLTFLNGELMLCNRPPIDAPVLDTLEMVKIVEPGKRASLDAMADRHGVDRTNRSLHGALVDARLLAGVYINMTRRQTGLDLGMGSAQKVGASKVDLSSWNNKLVASPLDPVELAAHEAYLESLNAETKGACVWLSSSNPSVPRMKP